MNVLIIGAKAAGLKAGCRIKRLLPASSVVVLDEGENVSLAACGLPYFLSGDIEQLSKLVTTPYDVERSPEYFAEAKGIDVLTNIRADSIDTAKHIVKCTEVRTSEPREFSYDHLILATGASAIIPPIEGMDLQGVSVFTSASDAIALRQAAAQGKIEKAAIIGGGFIGCEIAEALGALWGIQVTLFERESQILPQILDDEMAQIVQQELLRQGATIYNGMGISAIEQDGEKLKLSTDIGFAFEGFDRIVVTAGVKPRVELAEQAGIELGETGGIKVDAQMCTNLPNIFAAGDCVESTNIVTGKPCYLPLGSLANRMGRVAANTIAGKDDSFGAVCGSSCVKVYDMNVAVVGMTASAASDAGFNVGESWGYFAETFSYSG